LDKPVSTLLNLEPSGEMVFVLYSREALASDKVIIIIIIIFRY
jgi:hypothetical protein